MHVYSTFWYLFLLTFSCPIPTDHLSFPTSPLSNIVSSPPPLNSSPFLWVAQWVSLGLLRELWVRGWSQEHGTFSVTISPKKMSLLLLATLAAWKHSGRSVTHDRYRYSCCQVQEAMAMPCPGFSVAHHLTSVCFWFLYTSSLSMFFESGEG